MTNPEEEKEPVMICCPACDGWGYDTAQDFDTCNDSCPVCNGDCLVPESAEQAFDRRENATERERL